MDSFQNPLKKQLDSLECHFTWKLSSNRELVESLREYLEVFREGGGCLLESHWYNLLGYFDYHIQDSAEEARVHLQQAEVVLKEQEPEGRGPRLLVNQANLAWVHYHLGELPECQKYLEEVAQLQEEFPAPPGCDLHPEIYGEKGWTQVKFEYDFKKQAIANFEKALRGDPDRKEWHVGLAMAKYIVHFDLGNDTLKEEIIEQLKRAKTMDPDNLRISIMYLTALAAVGRKTAETTREAEHLLKKIRPGCDALRDLIRFFRMYESLDRAIQLAEEVMRKYPSEKEAKKQLAHCYRWKILGSQGNIDQELMTKAINIYEDVMSLYPYRADFEMNLAGLYAKSGNIQKADQIYKDLLSRGKDLEPKTLQLLYSKYAKHLNFEKKMSAESIDYHKKVVAIPIDSKEKRDSDRILNQRSNASRRSRW